QSAGDQHEARKFEERDLLYGEMSGEVEQRLAPINLSKFAGMHEFVAEPGKSARIEGVRDPIEDVTHARDGRDLGMVGKINVARVASLELERNQSLGDGGRIGRQPADAGTAADRERMGTARVAAHANHGGRRAVADNRGVELPRGGLLGTMEHQTMVGK